MILNPFYILILIYTVGNTVSFIKIISAGGFYVFDNFWYISTEITILSYLLQLFFLISIYSFYRISLYKNYQNRQLNNNWGYFLLFITTLFFIFNLMTGAGKAGSGFSFEGGSFVNIIFVLLQPDLLFFIIAPFLISKRLFWLSVLIYFMSLLSRGWMGAIFLIFIVYLIREYPLKLNIKRSLVFLTFIIIVMLSLPLLDALKWGLRLDLTLDQIILDLTNRNYFETFYIVIDSVVSRFQNLTYVAYVIENREFYLDALLSGEVIWFYQGGIINSIYCKIASCAPDLNLYVASTMINDYTISWNVDPGVSGWIGLLGFYSIYFFVFSFFLLIISYLIYKRMYGTKGVLLLGVFSLLYFFHGWFNAFYNVIIYGFIFFLIFKIKIKRSFK